MLTIYEWFLLGLLVVAIILVCVGAADYYGDRPVYNTDQLEKARGTASVDQDAGVHGRHHQEDGYGTARLGPFPPKIVHPRGM